MTDIEYDLTEIQIKAVKRLNRQSGQQNALVLVFGIIMVILPRLMHEKFRNLFPIVRWDQSWTIRWYIVLI